MFNRSVSGGGRKNCFFKQLILLLKMVAVEFLCLSERNCSSFLNKWLLFFVYLVNRYKPVLIKVTSMSCWW